MNVTHATLHERLAALDQQAWLARFHSRNELRRLVDDMLRLAPTGSAAEAKGHYHCAVWAWQANEREQSRTARARALSIFEQHGDIAGIANCRDLEALAERLAGNLQHAAELYKINRDLPESARAAAEHCMTCSGEGAVLLATGQHDACQRVWSIAVSLAQRASNPGLEVSTLCNLGAWNIAVCNFEDGRQLSQRAFDLAEQVFDLAHPEELNSGWFNSGMNLLVALDCLSRQAEAMAVASRLLEMEAHFPSSQRANYFVTFASAMLHAGNVEQAGYFLQRSIAAGGVTPDFALEQSIVQAEIWNRLGEYGRTQSLCAKLHDNASVQRNDVSTHDLMRFHNAATFANEALGDFQAALAHQKIAFDKYEELAGKSARARRLTLEIQTELQRTEWQRDQALKQRRAAELEQTRLAELNAALAAANTAKSGFLAAASHDLRQPAHAVSLLADTLASQLNGAPQLELVSRIQHSTAALQRLLSELLDISELDAGATIAHPRAIPVSDLLVEVDAEFRELAVSRNLQLRLAATDAWVVSDTGHLRRIMRSLLTNALNYTERGGVLVAARTRKGAVLLEVWDTGVGIAAEHLPHLFDAFYQVGNRARDRRKGLGLGLAVARRLAGLLGHPLEVHSRPGRGTVVRLTLPGATRLIDSQAT